MKRLFWVVMVVVLSLVVAGCGKKSVADVRTDLEKKVSGLEGYKATGTMYLKTGALPQEYAVEVWYEAPNNYRVDLKNTSKDQNQIILRNPSGVYVLTPALNKSFQFQSEWPENGGQVYLYQSLVKDIVAADGKDEKAKFKTTKNSYVFETKTRYANNQALPMQEISINKKTLAPEWVKIMNKERNVVVEMKFDKFTFDPKFGKTDFEVEKNMTGAQLEGGSQHEDEENTSFDVRYPSEEIAGTVLVGEKVIQENDREQVVMTFAGDGKSYTLIQGKAEVAETVSSIMQIGDPVDLGFTVATVTDHSISWTYDGVDFMLASKDLTREEMIAVAGSVQIRATEK